MEHFAHASQIRSVWMRGWRHPHAPLKSRSARRAPTTALHSRCFLRVLLPSLGSADIVRAGIAPGLSLHTLKRERQGGATLLFSAALKGSPHRIQSFFTTKEPSGHSTRDSRREIRAPPPPTPCWPPPTTQSPLKKPWVACGCSRSRSPPHGPPRMVGW